MARPRRLVVAYLLGTLLLLPASLHPPTAYAAPGDPPSGSPADSVYQLPLEQGRSDAAPKGSGGTAAGGGGSGSASTGSAAESGEAGSLYRSENNFGSSSRVPGAASGAAGAGSSKGDSAGGKSGTANGGAAAGGAGAPTTETAGTGNTSVPASLVLLGAIALLAIAAGVLSRRFRAR